jgi:hypothetical protein
MAELIEKDLNQMVKMEDPDRFQDQFIQPYNRYNPKFDFYRANWIQLDENGKPLKNDKTQNWVQAKLQVENRIRYNTVRLMNFWQKTIHPKWIQAIKDYQLTTIDRAILLKQKCMEYLTNEKQPIVRTYTDRVISWLFTGLYSVKVYAQDEAKIKKTKLVQHFIEWCFSSSKWRKTILDSSVDAVLLWTWFYRVWFKPARQYIQSIKEWEPDKTYPVDEVYATSNYESWFNIFWEPHRDFYDQPIIYRNFYPIRTIIKSKKDFFRLDKDQVSLILNSPQPFSIINFNKVKLIKYYEEYLLNWDLWITERQLYEVKLNSDMCEYVEYWDWANLAIAINWYIVYDYKNPLETKRHPFKVINYTRNPGVWIWDWVGTILSWTQKLYDAMFNIMFDLAKFNAWPMFLLKPWQFIEWNEKVLNYEPFTFHQLRSPDSSNIEALWMPQLDAWNFKIMNDVLDMANFAISPSTYNQLQGVSRSATDSEYRFQSLRDSLRPLSESINEAFTETVKDWLIMAKKNMPNKFKIAILWPDQKELFTSMKLSDLRGNYIFETEFESLKDINKTQEKWQLADFLNVIKTVWTDPTTWRWLINMELLTPHILKLYTNSDNFNLSKEEYYQMLLDSQVNMAEINKQVAILQEAATWATWALPEAWTQYKEITPPVETQASAEWNQSVEEAPVETQSSYNANEWQEFDAAAIIKKLAE